MKGFKNVRFIVLFVVMCFVLIGCRKAVDYKDQWTRDYFESNYTKESTKAFLKEFEITFEDTYLLFNATSPEKTEDKLLCSMMYSIRVKNITDKDKNIRVKYFVPKELFEKLSMSSEVFETTQEMPVEPGKGLTSAMGFLMKHYDLLTVNEKKLYESARNDMDVIIESDGVEYFIKIDDGEVVE